MEKAEKDNNYTHILKYTGLFGGVQGLNILVSIIRNKLVALILGPAGMGLVSLFNSTLTLLANATNLGISMSGVREISEAYDQERDTYEREGLQQCPRLSQAIRVVRLWSFIVAVLGMVCCVALSPLLNRWTFTWGDHTLHFILLSPVVALMALTGGELSILKGTRRLRALAASSVYAVIATLFTTVPLYYFWGQAAIVPSLLLIALIQLLLTIIFSWRQFPIHFFWRRRQLFRGIGMVRVGIAFVLAGILGSGTDFLIRTYLNRTAGLDEIGFFNAGYMLTMTYAGLVFSAMETDYFPRLSAVQQIGKELNRIVNNQIEVSLLLVSPLLAAFITAAPLVVTLLYSDQFAPVTAMLRVTLLSMYFRALFLPMEYIALSRGDSVTYLIQESASDIFMLTAVIAGFALWGLTGTGVGLVVASVLIFLGDMGYIYLRYRFVLSRQAIGYLALQLLIGMLCCLLTWLFNGWLSWVCGGLLTIVSSLFSLFVIHKKTHLWTKMKEKWLHKRV
ncbi:MAG: oligosaccharide flippase family protein [Prevotellaceae bacterium]|nr:oligosaccharide flippase family protein [Prevotellaceae bacterium]